jgi:hypothetical protein
LRVGEFIRFQALAKVPLENLKRERKNPLATHLEKSLKFSHRIADTGRINQELINLDRSKSLLQFVSYMSVVVFIFVGAALSYRAAIEGLPGAFVYSYKARHDKIVEVTVDPRNDGSLELWGTNEWYEKSVPNLEEFLQKASGPTAVKPKESISAFIASRLFLLIIVQVLLIFWFYGPHKRQRKLAKLLGVDT